MNSRQFSSCSFSFENSWSTINHLDHLPLLEVKNYLFHRRLQVRIHTVSGKVCSSTLGMKIQRWDDNLLILLLSGLNNFSNFLSFFCWCCSPTRAMGSSFTKFFLITHNRHNSRQDSSVRVISSSQRPLPDNTIRVLTTDRCPCPRWDSNSLSQQASGRRPTP